jgi:glycosyltransferase involved in cell wall biosynthesis
VSRKRVLVLVPALRPPGGGSGAAAWMVEALRHVHDVTVLTAAPVDLDALNAFFGTSLRPGEIRTWTLPLGRRRTLDALPLALQHLRMALLIRACRARRADFDVILSADSEADLGCRGIQYVNCVGGFFRGGSRYDERADRWVHRLPLARRAYYAFCDALAPSTVAGMRANVTLVNSDWTAAVVERAYGLRGRTVYPPVAGEFAEVPWAERDDGFVCLGRLTPAKRVEQAIEVLTAVRAHTPRVRLHIVGAPDGDGAYARRIEALARAAGGWITVHGALSRAELVRLIAANRYGLHAMHEEPFGMAVAEMVRGGCIVWVPRSGGQVEIVGGHPRLTYATREEAVASILRTLEDPAEQAALRAHLVARRDLLSAERFMREIRDTVARFPAA